VTGTRGTAPHDRLKAEWAMLQGRTELIEQALPARFMTGITEHRIVERHDRGLMEFSWDRSGALSCYTGGRIPPVTISTESSEDKNEDPEELYEVRIIDNDVNTYAEVMHITMAALGIPEDLAFAVAWEVDHAGSCVVAHAPHSQAEAIASVIRTIGIEVQVNRIQGGSI
jgi:ATP-dependent Clp protease adapter protein ClpS